MEISISVEQIVLKSRAVNPLLWLYVKVKVEIQNIRCDNFYYFWKCEVFLSTFSMEINGAQLKTSPQASTFTQWLFSMHSHSSCPLLYPLVESLSYPLNLTSGICCVKIKRTLQTCGLKHLCEKVFVLGTVHLLCKHRRVGVRSVMTIDRYVDYGFG